MATEGKGAPVAPPVERIKFRAAPVQIRLGSCRPVPERIEEIVSSYEMTAHALGSEEGENRLGGMLVRQRSEVMAIQNGILDSLDRAIPEVKSEVERALVELAFDVARRLVAALPITVEMMEAEIQNALRQLEEGSGHTVLVHPEDMELLEKNGSGLTSTREGSTGVRLEASPEVGRGGCIVQSRFGVIDARREVKMQAVRDLLLS